MNSSGANKMLVVLVVVLLLTNAAMLFYFTRGDKEEPKTRSERQIEYVRRELKLDDEQLAQYKQLRVVRDSIMKPMNEALREAKMKMIGYLRQPAGSVPDSLIWQTAGEITEKQRPIEAAYYHHFSRVKAICRSDQLNLFDTIMVRMVKRNTGGDKKSTDKK